MDKKEIKDLTKTSSNVSNFTFLNNIRKKITIKDNNYFFDYFSRCFYYFKFFVYFLFPMIIFVILSNDYNSYLNIFFINLYIFGCLVFLMIFGTISLLTKNYSARVIDLNNNSFYTEYCIFSIKLKFNIINPNDIKYVCNNVVATLNNPEISKTGCYEGRRIEYNEKTNCLQFYYVSFLLNNGTIYNFLQIGPFLEDYYDSIQIVNAISKQWNIPSFICKDDCRLVAEKSSLGEYSLKEKKLFPITASFGFLLLFLYIIFIFIFLYIESRIYWK